MATSVLITRVLGHAKDKDGGLQECLAAARVHERLVETFKAEGVETLGDLVGYFASSKYEEETIVFRDKVEELRARQVEIARLRTAYQVAVQVVEATQQSMKAGSTTPAATDLEAPLAKDEDNSVKQGWKRYNITLTMYMDPVDSLVNRVYREFRISQPTLFRMEQVKSTFQGNKPHEEKRHPLPGGGAITYDEMSDEVIRDVVGYYFCMCVVANAYAKGGNFG